jgi:ATP-dependent Zn protease
MNADYKELATAYHEAGHAVVSCYFDRIPVNVSVVSMGNIVGSVEFNDDIPEHFTNYFGKSDDKKQYVQMRIIIKLAGSLAHDLFDPHRIRDSGDKFDDRWAMAIIEDRASWAEDDRDDYLESCRNGAKEIVRCNWSWITNVAIELIEKKTLTGEDVLKLRS